MGALKGYTAFKNQLTSSLASGAVVTASLTITNHGHFRARKFKIANTNFHAADMSLSRVKQIKNLLDKLRRYLAASKITAAASQKSVVDFIQSLNWSLCSPGLFVIALGERCGWMLKFNIGTLCLLFFVNKTLLLSRM